MAAELKSAMDKGELKKLLMTSKKQPVNCALALGDGKTTALGLILLDRVKAPKAVEKELTKQFPDAKNARWGTAVVDVDDDPKLVKFAINKAISGMAKRLVKSLKGTGISKVSLVLEDGTPLESDAEEDDEQAPAPGAQPASAAPGEAAQPAQPSPEPAAAAPSGPAQAGTSPAAPGQPKSGPDLQALTKTLTDLVRQMLAAIAQNPSAKSQLTELAGAAQASLKRGDAQQTQAGIEALRNALAKAGSTAPGSAPGPQAPTPSPAIAKARQAWVATRQKVDADISNLHDAFTAAFKDHGRQGDLTKAFRDRVDSVLETLDEALAHKLDAVNGATDAGERAKLVQEAHTLIDGYNKHVASDPTIAELDKNPFVPLSIQKTMTATLTALSKAIR